MAVYINSASFDNLFENHNVKLQGIRDLIDLKVNVNMEGMPFKDFNITMSNIGFEYSGFKDPVEWTWFLTNFD